MRVFVFGSAFVENTYTHTYTLIYFNIVKHDNLNIEPIVHALSFALRAQPIELISNYGL